MIIEMFLTGFLFLFILVLNIPMLALGYKMELGESTSEAELQKINDDPKRFKITIGLALIEHGCVIALPIMLFIVFGFYSLILGIVWVIFRTGEGLIQFLNEKNYWGLLSISEQYLGASEAKKNSLSGLALTIFKTKESRFKLAMVFWAVGTFAYSVMFVTFGIAPLLLGWFGIVVSILVGFGNGMHLVKPKFNVLLAIGGLSAILFELIIGGWLVFQSLTL
ncbi:MAG: DUF4386 domain-containing protein [Candidatus Thorarchaeota archaeon]|jgi:hypothetical protein